MKPFFFCLAATAFGFATLASLPAKSQVTSSQVHAIHVESIMTFEDGVSMPVTSSFNCRTGYSRSYLEGEWSEWEPYEVGSRAHKLCVGYSL